MKNINLEQQISEVIHLIQSGSLFDAEKNLLKLIQTQPEDSDLYNLIGIVYSLRNLHEEAIDWFERGINISKKNDGLYLNLGTSLMSLEKTKEAIDAFNEALVINPNSEHAYYNLGNLYLDLKKYEDSIKIYDKALKIKNDFVDCLINKAVALTKQGKAEEALFEYEKAIALEPTNLKIHLNLASLYEINKKFDKALTHYDQATQIKPDYPEAWNNKGIIFGELKQYEEALAHYDQAIQIKPDYPEAWNNKGVIFGELKQYEEAVKHYKQALCLDKKINWSLGNLIHSKLMIADWENIDNEIDSLKKRISEFQNATTPFPLLSAIDDENLHHVVAKNYVDNKFPYQKKLGEIKTKVKSEKIKIAYVSSDFRNHPVIYLLEEIFELHNRKEFIIIAFNTGSNISGEEGERLKKLFDHFVEAGELSDIKIAEISRQLSIDIAINLGGHTNNSRTNIFAYRAAPIQVNFLGYPGTIGAEYIDYIIADKRVIPEKSLKNYSERVVWMPNTFLPYDSKRGPSKKKSTRFEFSLPENKFIYCCFNNAYKFNPRMIRLWSKIIEKNQESVLWLSSNNPIFQKNITNEFIKNGVSKDRVIFANKINNHMEYISAYGVANLFLDTSPYNAHATALDALRGGLPVLTMTGKSFAGRVGASIMSSKNLHELIANNDEEYIEKAIHYSKSKNDYESIKIKVNLSNENLKSKSINYCKELEEIYKKLVRNLNNVY